MKYAIYPHEWAETVQVVDAEHERVELADADFLIFNGQPEEFPELPSQLGFVQVPFAGVDHLLSIMRDSSVRWSNAAGLFDSTVAESTLGLILAQYHAHRFVDTWENRAEVEAHTRFFFDDARVAIIGCGGIGKRLIKLLEPFGVPVIAVNRSGRDVGAETVSFAQLDTVWPRANVFVLLAPLTPETRHLVDEKALAAMPADAVVVNVGRGPLVDTDALVAALEAKQIAGAALDVTDPEPLPRDHPLWQNRSVVITPHLANPPYSVRARIGAHTLAAARAFAAGESMPCEVDVVAGY